MPETVAEVLEFYKQYSKDTGKEAEYALTQTALIRFTVGGWGGPIPSGRKATAAAVAEGLRFLEKVPLSELENALAVQNQVFDRMGISKARRRGPRCYLKKIIDWAAKRGWIGQQPIDERPNLHRFSSPRGQRRQYKKRLTDRKIASPHTLGSRKDDFINKKLQAEIDTYSEFCTKNLTVREATVKKNLRYILCILGWLHQYKSFPLDSLSLQSIIPFVQLKLRLRDFRDEAGQIDMNQYWVAKAMAREEAKDLAVDVVQLCDEYVTFLNCHPKTHHQIMDAMLSVAKYVYRKETDSEEFANYEDIPVIQRLRKRWREVGEISKNVAPSVSYETKSVPWIQALEVLEKLRVEADLISMFYEDKRRNSFMKRRRLPKSIATSLHKFLVVGFMTLMPPDRSRTYQELEVGKTLKQGIFHMATFIPIERMQDPLQARWYIHLRPNDYKTGKTYGEWWGEVPNTQFPDGKTFYEYIARWLQEERAYLNPQHDRFFTQQDGRPFVANSLAQYIRTIFMRFTGVPVTPKEFRKMYITHLKNLGATETELEAAAAWMHHSRYMQSRTYNQQEQQAKLQPVLALNQRILQSALKGV
ncbi:MAG TPA: hypothetical protein V6D10_00985 [Trichocoleus sp.]|jgi:hypothetical protein